MKRVDPELITRWQDALQHQFQPPWWVRLFRRITRAIIGDHQ